MFTYMPELAVGPLESIVDNLHIPDHTRYFSINAL